MKRTQLKDALRNIWKQKVSYLSIIVIAFLGVTTFLGIDYSAGALRQNGSALYNEQNFRDIEIVSTLLMSGEDMDAIRNTDGVAEAEAVWQTSAKVSSGENRRDVSVISLTERINLPQLVRGHLPDSAGECAVEQRLAEEMGWQTGDRITLQNAAGETPQYLLDREYVITGIADHPDHTSLNVPDTPYVMVTADAFDMDALDDCFMKAEIMIGKEADTDRFSEDYEDAVAEVMARLEALSEARTTLRDESVQEQYQEELDAGRSALDEGRAALEESRAELDEGWTALAEGEQTLADGEQQLSDAEQQLSDAWQQLLDAKAQLEEAEAQLAAAAAELADGRAELDSGYAQLSSARSQLLSGWEALEDAKETVRNLIRSRLEEAYGGDTSAFIDWAPRMDVDLSSYSASAKEFWITNSFKVDLNLSQEEIVSGLIYSGSIPDAVLVAAYENLVGGAE